MELDFRAFAFIITLAAVVNGLGIVRWVAGFAEYLRKKNSLQINHYWVFSLWAAAQFLLHILLWWSLWGVREAETFNFLIYLYVLTGPILLYLGTSLLVPDVDENIVDLTAHYFEVRRAYFSVFVLLWLWAIFVWPVLRGIFSPTTPILTLYLATAVILRFTDNPKVHAVLVVMSWILLVAFVALFGMQLGGVARLMT
jgi:hypothetical protein